MTITNVETQQSRVVKSDSSGIFDAEALPAAGTLYNVTVKKEGFQTFASQGVKLDPGARVTVNATLQVGNTVTQVTVEASAVQVNTSTGESAGTLNGRTEIETSLARAYPETRFAL